MINTTAVQNAPLSQGITPTIAPLAPSAAAGAVGTLVGTASPLGVGSILGSLADSLVSVFTGLWKKGTPHMDLDTAQQYADRTGAQLEQSILDRYGVTKTNDIRTKFRAYMISFLQSTNRWGEGYPTNKAEIINSLLVKTINPPAIRGTYFYWGVWALRNTDASSADEFRLVQANDMGATLIRAIRDVTGETVTITTPPGSAVGQSGSGTGVTGIGTPAPPVSTGTTIAGIGSLSSVIGIVAVVILIGVFFSKR